MGGERDDFLVIKIALRNKSDGKGANERNECHGYANDQPFASIAFYNSLCCLHAVTALKATDLEFLPEQRKCSWESGKTMRKGREFSPSVVEGL